MLWIGNGWAIDARLGQIARKHEDIEDDIEDIDVTLLHTAV
ncbi:nucleotidyltransferase domain-containing protein [Thermocoleostomius sinensis]